MAHENSNLLYRLAQRLRRETGTKRTSDTWQRLSPHVEVLDPDGWDRRNWQHSWYEELITRHEYERRLGESTIAIKGGPRS
jgi:hypothetical protein